jgi:hypothetical protein
MKSFRLVAAALPLALLALSCARDESHRITAPDVPSRSSVQEASWVRDPAALAGAVRAVQASPLVQAAITEVPFPDLTPMPQFAVRAVGRMSDGTLTAFTILPFVVGRDSTHALFVTLADYGGRPLVVGGELILGRAPTSLETGFEQLLVLGRVGWYRSGPTYGPDGVKRAPERFRPEKFTQCFMQWADKACQAGSAAGQALAPQVPAIAAIGCGLGVAAAAIGCAASAFLG